MDRAMAACMEVPTQSNNSDLSDVLIAVGFVLSETAILIDRHDGELTEALKEACQRDQVLYGDSAISRILGQMKPNRLVTAALAVDNQVVTSAAAAAVISTPTLLAGLSLRNPQVQRVWSEALKSNVVAWQIKPNVGALRNEVFDILLDDELALDLLEHLVSSPLGNALDYPRRVEVWRALPPGYRNVCLASTAAAWARSLSDRVSQADYLDPEHELAMTLASPKMFQEMKTALERLQFKDVLNVFAGNSQLPETLFAAIFTTYRSTRHPSGTELDEAAQLVVARGWRNFTRSLLKHQGMSDDLRAFFRICADHLDFWDRVLHGLSLPSTSELDDLFTETACQLYPSGPMEREIWGRAGGDPAQLDVSGTGKGQWDRAIRNIRNGNQVCATSLIAAMRDDYPLNHQLNYLTKVYR